MEIEMDDKEWSQMIAELAADALVQGGVVQAEQYARAVEIIGEEVLVRLCLGNRPPKD